MICAILFLVDAIDRKYELIAHKTKTDSMLYYPFVKFANGVYESIVE